MAPKTETDSSSLNPLLKVENSGALRPVISDWANVRSFVFNSTIIKTSQIKFVKES